ncbi:MAG: Hsp20 family protein [Silicimonas sp.]|jgi:HSP20 family molecular chaperone IbpA|nr:Hsp20 family protein [Silicimonas sp.]
MSKLSLGTHPFLLGFDQLERMVERTARSENGYPPYNIEQVDQGAFRITLAVAGFSEDDLSITIEDRQLVVRGKQDEEGEERVFLHRGIAARQFQRTFLLAEGVEVSTATLANGLLHIELSRKTPERIVQSIRIDRS